MLRGMDTSHTVSDPPSSAEQPRRPRLDVHITLPPELMLQIDEWSRPSSWWRFGIVAEGRRIRRHQWKYCLQSVRPRAAIDGIADCAAATVPLSSPAPSAHRCAAAGLDTGAPAERGASMPFDGELDRLKWVRPRMGSAGDRRGRPARPAPPSLQPAYSGVAAATHHFVRAAPRRSAARSQLHWGRCRRHRRGV